MIKLGEKIKSLRKQKNISQEVFSNYLGVSFQAVSKWENGNTLPDVTLIPAIASLLYFQSPCHRATLYRVVCVPRVRVRETTLLISLKSRTHTHVYIL